MENSLKAELFHCTEVNKNIVHKLVSLYSQFKRERSAG